MGKNILMKQLKREQVIICSKKCKYKKKNTIIKTSNIRYFLSQISSKFYKLKTKKYYCSNWHKWKNFSCRFILSNIKTK